MNFRTETSSAPAAKSSGANESKLAATYFPRRNIGWHLLLLAIAFVGWGTRPLMVPDEARYGEAAREMIEFHDWLVPRLAGEVHLTKPPVTYWLIASGMRIFGTNPWGARFFLAVFFFLLLETIVSIGRKWGWEERRCRLAAVIYGTGGLSFACGHLLTTDLFVATFQALGVLCAFRAWNGGNRSALWCAGFWLSFALAFLTKGPPGLVAMLALLVFSATPQARAMPGRVWRPWGPLLFAAIALPWFFLAAAYQPQGIKSFVVGEVLNRVLTDVHGRSKPFWYFIPVLAAALVPWVGLWPAAARRLRTDFREGWRAMPAWRLFCVVWFALGFVVFSAAKSKLLLYVVPLLVPLSLMFASVMNLDRVLDWWRRARTARIAAIAGATVWALAMVLFASAPPSWVGARDSSALADAIRSESSRSGRPIAVFDQTGAVPFDLAFTLGQTIPRIDNISSPAMKEFAAREARRTKRQVVIIIDDDHVARVLAWHSGSRVVGMGRKTAAVTFDE